MKKLIATILCAVLVVLAIPIFGSFAMSEVTQETEDEYTYTGLGNQVKRKDEELSRKYEQGITMESEQIEARKERVKELGLEEYVDDRFFLFKEYYNQFSVSELEQKGMTLLVECMTEEDIEAWEMRLKSGVSPMYITKGNDLISWTNSAGITTRTYAFDVDGHVAFCGDHGLTAPPTGTVHSAYIPVTNAQLNKILYYGYGGPQDQMTKLGYSRAKSYVIMAMCASNLRRGQALGANGAVFWDAIKNLPDPTSGSGYYVETYQSDLQDLFFYDEPQEGTFKMTKKSSDTVIVSGNNCYSLEGAEYGVYTNPDGVSGYVTTLKTGSNGATQEIELKAGTYYIKELKAPPGYILDETIYRVAIAAGENTSSSYQDKPQKYLIDILLNKVDAETNQNQPQGDATLKGAQFTVKFYPGIWEKNTDPSTLGKTPERTWVFETDEEGVVKYQDAYKISGDELFAELPLGTLTIQETKASEGYLLNPIVYIVPLESQGTTEIISTYNKSIIPENILKLNLVKKQEGTEITIPEAEFKHVKPDNTTEVLKTNAKGELEIKGLQYGTHQLKEISVMAGYEINKNVIEFTVAEDNKITFLSKPELSEGNVKFEVTKEGNISIEMEDKLSPFDLLVHKKNDKNVKLEGAEFTLYAEKECIQKVDVGVTGNDGILRLEGLEVGKKYYLKETKAPAGYRMQTDIFGNPVVYEIYAESTPVKDEFIFYVNGKVSENFTVTGTKAHREGNITIENRIGRRLPQTGSIVVPLILVSGVICFGIAIFYSKKKRY